MVVPSRGFDEDGGGKGWKERGEVKSKRPERMFVLFLIFVLLGKADCSRQWKKGGGGGGCLNWNRDMPKKGQSTKTEGLSEHDWTQVGMVSSYKIIRRCKKRDANPEGLSFCSALKPHTLHRREI